VIPRLRGDGVDSPDTPGRARTDMELIDEDPMLQVHTIILLPSCRFCKVVPRPAADDRYAALHGADHLP
jgi:hypothetical protein